MGESFPLTNSDFSTWVETTNQISLVITIMVKFWLIIGDQMVTMIMSMAIMIGHDSMMIYKYD